MHYVNVTNKLILALWIYNMYLKISWKAQDNGNCATPVLL